MKLQTSRSEFLKNRKLNLKFKLLQSWTLASGHLRNMAKSACSAKLAKSAYFRSASSESDNKMPFDTLTCLKPMTI